MTVTKAMIGYISPFTVSEGLVTGDISDEAYSFYLAVAQQKLDDENPGLSETQYDLCHALLIVHFYASKRGDLELTSESLGGVRSITKREGVTSWLLQYEGIIRDKKTKSNLDSIGTHQSGVYERCDRVMPDLELDRQPIPMYDGLSINPSDTVHYYDD